MVDDLLSIVAPHHCCSCDKVGTVLCDNCKYNIICEQKPICLVCGRPTKQSWFCNECVTTYERAWAVGERSGVLQRLIGNYKFERVKAAYIPLAELLLSALPDLPLETIIVPIPTVPSHVRERGYDHMLLIARHLAKIKHLSYKRLLERATNTKQRQANVKLRQSQAKKAFSVDGLIDPEVPYLIIDDVVTTGATIKYAAKALKKAGAKHIWVAVIARQPKK